MSWTLQILCNSFFLHEDRQNMDYHRQFQSISLELTDSLTYAGHN